MTEKHPQMPPESHAQAPDPARSYERAKPYKEAGMGRLDNNNATPERSDERAEQAVTHRQANRQINAEDVVDQRAGNPARGEAIAPQPDHSMNEEEPMGWDQAPQDIHNPRALCQLDKNVRGFRLDRTVTVVGLSACKSREA